MSNPNEEYINTPGLLTSSPRATNYGKPIIRFKLRAPNNPTLFTPSYQQLFQAYNDIGGKGNGGGTSFIMYALVQELTESLEQAITSKRSKGGFVEAHWGSKPSVITCSGVIGVQLSALGLTPFQTEKGENVAYWDPTSPVAILQNGVPQTTANVGNNTSLFNNQLQNLASQAVDTVGSHISGALGNLLSTANFKSTTSKPSATGLNQYPQFNASQNVIAGTGTNAAFRKFRMILDLFKQNGVIFDSIPNPDIYPSTYTAGYTYVDHSGKVQTSPSIIELAAAANTSIDTYMKNLRGENIAPGNVRTVTPIEIYVKDTVFSGYFQNFNYSLSENDPFTAHYDFTFISKITTRSAVFFPNGTAGRRPFSSLIVANQPLPSRRPR